MEKGFEETKRFFFVRFGLTTKKIYIFNVIRTTINISLSDRSSIAITRLN